MKVSERHRLPRLREQEDVSGGSPPPNNLLWQKGPSPLAAATSPLKVPIHPSYGTGGKHDDGVKTSGGRRQHYVAASSGV